MTQAEQQIAFSVSPLTYVILFVFAFVVFLFFWAVYKALKTQKKLYIWAMLPFFLFILGMFLL